MMMNGPKMRLKSAPGRRTVSRTSLPMKDVVRVQVLSSPSNASRITDTAVLLFSRVALACFRYKLRENFVEGRAIFADRQHFHTGALNGLQQARRRGAGIVGDDQEVPRRTLAHRAHAGHLVETGRIERLSGFDFDDS